MEAIQLRDVAKPRVNLVVSCTARKTTGVEFSAHMRQVVGIDLESRAKEWFTRLNQIRTGCRPAMKMYCGSAWTPVLGISKLSDINIWIISAGYGLLHHSDVIVPYAATFSSAHLDSVSRNNLFHASDWWIKCCSLNKRQKTISDLAKENPDVPIIVAVSKPYLEAVKWDLFSAKSMLVSRRLLSIISVGSPKNGVFESNILPCDTRMEQVIGLGRSSLNTRILGDVMNNHHAEFDFDSLYSFITNRQQYKNPTSYPVRDRMTDKEVSDFITKNVGVSQSFTVILKKLRDSGCACEYKRFKQLFNCALKPLAQ
jgi:hypothetical protein